MEKKRNTDGYGYHGNGCGQIKQKSPGKQRCLQQRADGRVPTRICIRPDTKNKSLQRIHCLPPSNGEERMGKNQEEMRSKCRRKKVRFNLKKNTTHEVAEKDESRNGQEWMWEAFKRRRKEKEEERNKDIETKKILTELRKEISKLWVVNCVVAE